MAEEEARGTERLTLHPPGDWVSDEIRRTGRWFEQDILEAVADRVKPGTFIDAGAHLGNHTVYLALHTAHEVILAFEPWPENYALLLANTYRLSRVRPYPYALSDRHGTVRLLEDANRGHVRVDPAGRQTAMAIRLDSLMLDDVTLLKIDVEGHEPAVLRGAQRTIESCRPLVLIEDWTGHYGDLLPGYELIEEWGTKHQTYLFGPR